MRKVYLLTYAFNFVEDGPEKMADLPARVDLSRCAVVGSSASLLMYPMGKEIDRHTATFRFNDAPTQGYECAVRGLRHRSPLKVDQACLYPRSCLSGPRLAARQMCAL